MADPDAHAFSPRLDFQGNTMSYRSGSPQYRRLSLMSLAMLSVLPLLARAADDAAPPAATAQADGVPAAQDGSVKRLSLIHI